MSQKQNAKAENAAADNEKAEESSVAQNTSPVENIVLVADDKSTVHSENAASIVEEIENNTSETEKSAAKYAAAEGNNVVQNENPDLENGAEEKTNDSDDFVSPEMISSAEKKPLKLNLSRHIIAGVILVIAVLVLIISRMSREFADWFCFNIYPVFSGIGSHIWGVFSFSVAEIFVVSVILAALAGLVFLIRYVVKNKGSRIKAFFNCFSVAELTAAALFLIVTFNCLVGYNRTPFSQYSGLTLREYTTDELKELTLYLVDRANEIADKVDLDGKGRPVKPWEFNKYAVKAMESLGEKYDVLKTYYPQPKGVAASSVMSSFNLAGIYFPVTVEANFNQDMPVSSQGFTACHELSHLSGFIREDEANFIAFMACRESESTYFKYSGYLGALTYCLNALYGAVSSEEYSAVCSKLSSVILDEYAYRNEYWSPYQKKVTYKVSSVVNDTYLKANNQADGTKSYGRMVDLLLAEYFAEG